MTFLFVLEENMLAAQGTQFYVAGFVTIGSTISFTLYELCSNTSVQNRLRDEIQTVIKKHDGITYEAIQCMNYLDMTVKGISCPFSSFIAFLIACKQFLLQKH